jgi:hypothetical protein
MDSGLAPSARPGMTGDDSVWVEAALSGRSFAGVGDDPQTGRPNTVEPALALPDLCPQPSLVAISASLRTKALECSTLPHEAELAMAVGATIVHGFLPKWHFGRTDTVEDGDHYV